MKREDKRRTHHRDSRNFALGESLEYNKERVAIINENPQSKMFIWWFFISCYFPVITACMGPVANTISIACLVEKWRGYGTKSGHSDYGPAGVLVVNILSLVVGFLSNCVLVLHFVDRLSYIHSQIINIFGWTIAATMLLIDCCVFAFRDINHGTHKTVGFWYAMVAVFLYYCCTFNLLIHFIGFYLGKYPPRFNLMKNERALMIFTLCLSVLLIWGGAMFSGIVHVTFGAALYFSTVSILTVGLGDIAPNDVASKILLMVFSLFGVIILGLILAMTRSIIQESAGTTFFFHLVEVSRTKTLHHLHKHQMKLTRREAYNKMIKIRRSAKRRQMFFSIGIIMLIYVAFWNLGALVFMFAESWSYFNALYFCFLCLITIGYGDYTPKTGAGRAFFVCWSLAAVPLMSAILSTVGDYLFALAKSIDLTISSRFNVFPGIKSFVTGENKALNAIFTVPGNTKDYQEEINNYNASNDTSDDDDDNENDNNCDNESLRNAEENCNGVGAFDLDMSSSKFQNSPLYSGWDRFTLSDEMGTPSSPDYFRLKLERLQKLTQAMKEFHNISKKNRNYSLNYWQWSKLLQLYTTPENIHIIADSEFWLSDDSPLRFPLNEPNFAIARIFGKIESFLEELIDDVFNQLPENDNRTFEPISVIPTPRNSNDMHLRKRSASI